MTHWGKILCRLFAILLVWNVIIAEGLPSGDRLILCFGSDGHIDISFTARSKCLPNIPKTIKSLSDKNGHHGDCFDVELIAGALGSEQLILPEAGARKILPKKSDSSHVFDISFSSLSLSDYRFPKTFSLVSKESFSTSDLISLCTIILQV